MALYNFDEVNGTLLTTITGGSVCSAFAASASQMVTNGSGQGELTGIYTAGGIVKSGSNRSIVTLPANSSIDECVGAMVACDATNGGYRAVIDGASGTTFTQVKRLIDEVFDGYWTFTVPIDTSNGAVTLDANFDGTDWTLDVIQGGSTYQSFTNTPSSPLGRTGSGFYIKADATTAQIESWDDSGAGAVSSITNIDTDNSVQVGQVGAVITGVAFDLPIVSVDVEGEAITVTGTPTETSITVDIPANIALRVGREDLTLNVVDSTGTLSLSNVTLLPEAGWEYIALASLPDEGSTDSFYELSKTDVAVGNFIAEVNDVLLFESQAGLTVTDETLIIVEPPSSFTASYKWWDDSTGTYTNTGAFTVNDLGGPIKPVITSTTPVNLGESFTVTTDGSTDLNMITVTAIINGIDLGESTSKTNSTATFTAPSSGLELGTNYDLRIRGTL